MRKGFLLGPANKASEDQKPSEAADKKVTEVADKKVTESAGQNEAAEKKVAEGATATLPTPEKVIIQIFTHFHIRIPNEREIEGQKYSKQGFLMNPGRFLQQKLCE